MGPLEGVRVVELLGLGPAPFCGMLLADPGADVVRIERPGPDTPTGRINIMARGKRSVALNLKEASSLHAALDLISAADAVIDPFRPGVTEKLGLGPDDCMAGNPRLVYGRMTGWGQDGPYADSPGCTRFAHRERGDRVARTFSTRERRSTTSTEQQSAEGSMSEPSRIRSTRSSSPYSERPTTRQSWRPKDRALWPALRQRLAEVFLTRPVPSGPRPSPAVTTRAEVRNQGSAPHLETHCSTGWSRRSGSCPSSPWPVIPEGHSEIYPWTG